jgi:hypothetical protein
VSAATSGPPQPLQLPLNDAPYTTMLYVDPTDGRRLRSRIVTELACVPFELAPPIRSFPAYPGRRSHQGRHWFSQSKTSVPFESRFEMTALMSLDFRVEVRTVSSNPFWLLWPAGTPQKRHAPDFFARRGDGSVLVMDVKPEARITAADRASFGRTKAICDELRWDYEVFTSIDRNVERNLRVLYAYAHPRFAPSPAAREAMAGALRTANEQAMPLGDLVHSAARGLGAGQADSVVCGVYHLLWRGELHIELTYPLTWNTLVQR